MQEHVQGLLIRGGRVVDPARSRDEIADLFLEGGRVAPAPGTLPAGCEELDATGRLVVPGFWDIHVHLREPGEEAAETIETGSRAAARGGFTTLVAMPNTVPAIDTPEAVKAVLEQGRRAGHARVLTTACLTRGRQGEAPAPLAELAEAGAVGFTDDGATVQDDGVMREVMVRARELNLPVMDHAQDQVLERQGVMHQGAWSRRFGLPGIPACAEEKIVRRDGLLAAETGCRVHIQHLTSGGSVRILAEARERGARITGELTPHHLVLADADIDPEDANYKMNPPLRSVEDRTVLSRALLEGAIDILATDHAPHTLAAKRRGFLGAPFGVTGLETAVGVTYTALVRSGRMTVPDWVSRWTTGPAAVLGRPPPALEPGAPADVTLIDPDTAWTVDAASMVSRSVNTPFRGRTLFGRAVRTLLGGRTVWAG